MGKPGFGLFQGRRKSSGNVIDDLDVNTTSDTSPATEQSSFRVFTQEEREKRRSDNLKKAEKSKFAGRFSGFGSGTKNRSQSIDEESPSSSKRDSKSSSGTSSRPYNTGHYGGSSSSTLPSSADPDPNDNLFANAPPRPYMAQHSSSPGPMPMGSMRKELPQIPKSRTDEMSTRYYGNPYAETNLPNFEAGRPRGMTTSSYASTAIPPKLDSDLNFGGSGFDNMFEGLERKASPEHTKDPSGRSLLAGKRSVQAQPIKIDHQLEVEPPLQSWESRGSNENLISSSRDNDNDSPPPPPVPKHQYAPVATHSPIFNGSNGFQDNDARLVRESVIQRKTLRERSPDQKPAYAPSSSGTSLQTPLTSFSAHNTTPKAPLRVTTSSTLENEDEDEGEDLFAPAKAKDTHVPKPAAAVQKENIPPPQAGKKVMTAAEFEAASRHRATQPAEDSDEDEEYDDEEEAIERRQKEEQAIREKQRMQLARDHLKRITPNGADSSQPAMGGGTAIAGNGFPSEVSRHADEWDDEDVPLGILKAHGFPGQGKTPMVPADATPSYFRTTTPTIPDRPASAGPMGGQGGSGYRPPFARGLPADPHSAFIGGGLVHQTNRESMGFNRATSVYGGESTSGPQEPQFMSYVDRIQLQEMSKQKYNGGASSKTPQQQQGPFTGQFGNQMHMNQSLNPTRMSQMPMQGMNGMNGMNGMQGMNGMGMNGMNMMNPMMMNGGMPMMGMNQMNYPMDQNQLMAMQQMMQMQQMQQAQMMQASMLQNPHQQMSHDPRMSMLPPLPNFGGQNNGFLSAGGPGYGGQQRPMSVMSQQQRPYSTPSAGGAMPQVGPSMMMGVPQQNNGYTPSIAPSERSNIGLASRYRPVANTTNQDVSSNRSSSMTLQASGGAVPQKVKGILKGAKSPVPQLRVDDDDEDWAGMAARRNKFSRSGGSSPSREGLRDLARAVDGY